MNQFIKNYFTFNKQERNGVIVLLTIILSLLIALYFSGKSTPTTSTNFTEFENAIKKFEASKKATTTLAQTPETFTKRKEKNIQLFPFNPNNLSAEKWEQLGLSKKQISVIKNYESKGGGFFNKTDVKKMYCISDVQFAQLEPYIVIAENKNKIVNTPTSPVINHSTAKIIIELNTADSTQLLSLKGIGSFYAQQIIKRRNQLGGYYSSKQLLEVWKFDEEKLKYIESQVSINESFIKAININSCTAKQLKHPYLTWTQTNGIINYRNKHGLYKSIEEIKNTDLIDQETFEKIAPYLTIH